MSNATILYVWIYTNYEISFVEEAQRMYVRTYLSSTIWFKVCFYFQRKLIHERNTEPGLGVGVGIPCFFVQFQRRFRSDATKPAGQVSPYVVDLVGVLAGAIGAVRVGTVLDNLHRTAFSFALFTALFLKDKIEKEEERVTVEYV